MIVQNGRATMNPEAMQYAYAKIVAAEAVPAVDPEIGGYFVNVRDQFGNCGLLIEAYNLAFVTASALSEHVVGKRVSIWN